MQIGPSRTHSRPITQNGRDIGFLTDRERDEIDFEAKTIIRQTMDRVKTMEARENGIPPKAIG